jgi:hypothetical protein
MENCSMDVFRFSCPKNLDNIWVAVFIIQRAERGLCWITLATRPYILRHPAAIPVDDCHSRYQIRSGVMQRTSSASLP